MITVTGTWKSLSTGLQWSFFFFPIGGITHKIHPQIFCSSCATLTIEQYLIFFLLFRASRINIVNVFDIADFRNECLDINLIFIKRIKVIHAHCYLRKIFIEICIKIKWKYNLPLFFYSSISNPNQYVCTLTK